MHNSIKRYDERGVEGGGWRLETQIVVSNGRQKLILVLWQSIVDCRDCLRRRHRTVDNVFGGLYITRSATAQTVPREIRW